MPHSTAKPYSPQTQALLAHYTPAEREGLERLKNHIIRQYLAQSKLSADHTVENITQALTGKNLLVMYGGGKDSGIVLASARAAQQMMKDEYGVTFELRVGIGRHAGMVDVFPNIENAFEALKLKDDPSVDIFWIDRATTSSYKANETASVPDSVQTLSRHNVVMNGHIFSGVGRRTFCDSCNMGLGQWIAAGMAYGGGADLYMTGDNLTEINAQAGGEVPKLAAELGVLPEYQGGMSATQHTFKTLDNLSAALAQRTHGNTTEIEYPEVHKKTRFVSLFSDKIAGNSIGKNAKFLLDFLKMDIDTLAFSFTESDCGNPALMCHLYGLIAEHAYGDKGATYGDGIRMYLRHALPIMKQKEFPASLIREMKERYKDEAAIAKMRTRVENYALRAYNLTPENLTAMVYAPFTENGLGLDRYLQHLQKTGAIENPQEAKPIILAALAEGTALEPDSKEAEILTKMEELTGLNQNNMRQLYASDLLISHFVPQKHSENLGELLNKKDLLYISPRWLMHEGKRIAKMEVIGR